MMVAYTSEGGEPDGIDFGTPLVMVALAFVFAVLFCIGHAWSEGEFDTDPEYEVEMDDGTIYTCHKFTANDDGTTKLMNINGTKEDMAVFTHLIVRSERICSE